MTPLLLMRLNLYKNCRSSRETQYSYQLIDLKSQVFVQTATHSFTLLLTQSITQWHITLFAFLLTRRVTHSVTHLLTHSLFYSLFPSLTSLNSPPYSHVNSLPYLLTNSLTSCSRTRWLYFVLTAGKRYTIRNTVILQNCTLFGLK
jgi:hypothetical protein